MKNNRGFTLLELVLVLAIIGVMGGLIVTSAFTMIQRDREQDNLEAINAFKKGIVGDPRIVDKEVRTNFGYLGDMGSLPASIEDLYKQGTNPSFVYDSAKKTGAGWNGPYIDLPVLDEIPLVKKDVYDTAYIYSTSEFTEPTVGAVVSARIASHGTDKAAGTTDDLSTYIYRSEIMSDVIGFVKDGQGNRASGVDVKINYPSGGVLVESATQSQLDGLYQFSDIPYGNRSVMVIPKLLYAPDSGITTGQTYQDLELKVTNYASDDITITSMTINYSVTPPAYFTQIKIGTNLVFNSNSPRGSSGQTIIFPTPITITGNGAGVSGKSFPIRIQSPYTQVADISIGSGFGRGGTARFLITSFKDVISGNGADADMTGVTFNVEFSDGSKIFFSPERG